MALQLGWCDEGLATLFALVAEPVVHTIPETTANARAVAAANPSATAAAAAAEETIRSSEHL